MMFGEANEKIIDRLALLRDVWQLIHVVTESCRTRKPARVPRNVFARDTHSGIDPVEGIEVFKVGKENVVDFADSWG